MLDFSKRKARYELDREAENIGRDDVKKVLDRQQTIEQKVKNSGTLERFSTDVRLMFAMLQDYWQGNYRNIPWKSVAAIAAALIYVLNPLDLIPDFLLGFGFIDDAGVVAACLKLVESDLHRYAAWKEHREDTLDSKPEESVR